MDQEVKKEQEHGVEKKIQQILVPHDFSDAGKCAVSYGLMLAGIFQCELTLVHILTKKTLQASASPENTEAEARNRLAGVAARLQQNSRVKINAYVLRGPVNEVVKMIVIKINAIIVVAGLNTVNRTPSDYFSPSNLVSDYRELRIPLLIVHNKRPDPGAFDRIILPVDFSRESKEKASWAAYFGKKNSSYITLVHTEYKDAFFSIQLRNNLMLIHKLFSSLNTSYNTHKAERIKSDIERYALSYAKMKDAGMLIITATKDWGIDDFLLGPVEKKIITNEDQLPVMMINPRDDLFVPCV